jgi:type IV pilus assembly protein PilQ
MMVVWSSTRQLGRWHAIAVAVALVWLLSAPVEALGRRAPGHARESYGPTGYTFDFQDADIHTVLATLARAGHVNIVTSKEVEGSVTLRLANVTWRRALEEVLKTQRLDVTEDAPGVLRVAPVQVVRDEAIEREGAERKREELLPLSTRLVAVRFANAVELKNASEKILSPRGHVEVDERTNTLIITEIASQMERVLAIVQELDTSTQQVEIVAKLVDMDTGTARELGIRWRLSKRGRVAARFNEQIPEEGVLEGDEDAEKPGKDPHDVAAHFRLTDKILSLDATLSALESERKAQLLSNPRIVTVNNREARILVGQRIPLIVSDIAGNPVTQLQTIGIQLRVTPHINEAGTITLDIHPEVSDLSTQATVQGGVIINTSEADTRVVVQDGETAMIGGLIRDIESSTREGVPVLSRIPLLGGLFRYATKTKQNRELVIFITPRIMPHAHG